jgi:hypothetical protein
MRNYFHPQLWMFHIVFALGGIAFLIFSKNSFLLGFGSVLVLASFIYFVGLAIKNKKNI